MQPRRSLLNILADGRFHSGEELGDALGISRMAVWKHIHALRERGVDMEVVRGRGYRFPCPVELLDADTIHAATRPETRRRLAGIETLLEVDSTNNRLRQQALEGAPSGTVCLAEMQSAGRGRRSRNWVSPFAANLYLSLLWRSECGIAALGGMSLVCGVAVLRCLEQFSILSGGLKWPNDILVDDAKLAGILIDVIGESTGSCAVVVGVGINVAMPQQAGEEIGQPWTDLQSLCGVERFPRNLLAARALDCLLAAIDEFRRSGLQDFLDDWCRYDVMAGRQIDVRLPDRVVTGRACGIDETGALLVDTPGGRQRFASGEVSVRAVS
jgi:BirA family biotin operon repressor/biotin-[acetyl-CoA-carboxylase] ligase